MGGLELFAYVLTIMFFKTNYLCNLAIGLEIILNIILFLISETTLNYEVVHNFFQICSLFLRCLVIGNLDDILEYFELLYLPHFLSS